MPPSIVREPGTEGNAGFNEGDKHQGTSPKQTLPPESFEVTNLEPSFKDHLPTGSHSGSSVVGASIDDTKRPWSIDEPEYLDNMHELASVSI